MKTIETKTIIHSAKEMIWQTLMEFDSYPDWNPFIKSIEGTVEEGDYLIVKIQPEEMKVQKFKPEILTNKKNTEFRWKGKLFIPGLFDGEHYFLLNSLKDGSVEFVHGEKFSGLLSSPILKMIGSQTQAGFKAMNLALKQRVEAMTAARI